MEEASSFDVTLVFHPSISEPLLAKESQMAESLSNRVRELNSGANQVFGWLRAMSGLVELEPSMSADR
jgi:hypothetical protein